MEFVTIEQGRRYLLLSLLFFAISACAPGSGENLDISGRPLSEGGDVPLAATLASVQANVFNPGCVVCHAGASAPLGLRLDSANAFTNLVGVPSRQQSSVLRVAPGNPDQSYLVQKLEGTAAEGQQMPLGGPPVPQATIDFVRQWITDGALPDSGAGPDSAPVVISMTPDPGSILGTLPAEITAGFDQDMDASTINGLTFTLIRSGGDGQFDDGNEETVVPASVALSPANTRLAIMDLSGAAAVEDVYQITLHGSGPGMIQAIGGMALDGEFSGVFPSGDGDEGGDFTSIFELRGLQPTLQSIQDSIFTPTCSNVGCHTGPQGPGLPSGLDLTAAGSSFSSLVNVNSQQVPALRRVAPGDANNSYLIQKLEGTAAGGARMPQGGPFLDQTTIDVIRSWIDNGAPQ